MKKILVLGSKGNLGHQLIEVFGKGNNVIGLDRDEIDIVNKKRLSSEILSSNPDVIINATGYTMVDDCEDDEGGNLAEQINSTAVGYLAELAVKNNIILIHYSTDYVFDGSKKTGYREDDKVNPINKYGETKAAGEEKILNMGRRGLRFYLIRTSKLFSAEIAGKNSKPSFFKIMLDLAREKDEIKVVDEERGCFTYALDLAESTRLLLDEKYDYGIYHIVNEEAATWYEGALSMFEIANNRDINLVSVKSEEFPRPAKRPEYSILLNTKLPKLRNYKDALRDFYRKLI